MANRIYKKQTMIHAPIEQVFQWHERNGAIQRLTPPWAPMTLLYRKGNGVEKGVQVSFRLKIFNLPMTWNAEHIGFEENKEFKDTQTSGPFARWIHTHRFLSKNNDQTVMEDHIEYKLPMGLLSLPFYGMAQKDIDRMFVYRHQVLKDDLESDYDPGFQKTILVSGASGTIGSILVPYLRTQGHRVIQLVRTPDNLGPDQRYWDPYQKIIELDPNDPIDAVINLNGMDISRGRWTDTQKSRIMDSRVIPTRFLSEILAERQQKPEVFISSSAIGLYGDRSDTFLTEDEPRGECFISEVCDLWEDASLIAERAGIRTVQLRIGIVLTPAGGALQRMELPFKMGCGVRISHGQQFMSWISMEDTLSGILHILKTKSITGPVNLTAPHPVTNQQFSTSLAQVFSRKLYFVMPGWVVSLLWGEMGRETLLASARVKPDKLMKSGYRFKHETLMPALKTMLGR